MRNCTNIVQRAAGKSRAAELPDYCGTLKMATANDVVQIPCPMCRDIGAPTTLTQGKLQVVLQQKPMRNGRGAIVQCEVEIDTRALEMHILEVHS